MNYWWVECNSEVFGALKVWRGETESVAHCSSVTTDNITSFNLYNTRIDLFCVYLDCNQSSQLAQMAGDWVN